MSKYAHLWNNLPIEERKRLMPYAIETQIVHLKQGRLKAVEAHKKCLRDFDDHIRNCQRDLDKYETPELITKEQQ